MPGITITVTDAQVLALKRLDARKTPTAVIQIHVDTWLAPLVALASAVDADAVKAAYASADEPMRDAIRVRLGIG